MPLTKLEEIKPDKAIGIWHITESFEKLNSEITLNTEDKELLNSFNYKPKQLEWLAGRITLKRLCEHYSIAYNGIKKNEHGKPYLHGLNWEISLTHSYPYVAAIIDKYDSVGIDLEQPRQTLKTISHKYLNQEELHNANNEVDHLCIYWCAKETLYKIHGKKGLIFKDQIALDPIVINSIGNLNGKIIADNTIKCYKLQFRIDNDYILTFNV